MDAIVEGRLAILDGIHRLPFGTLSVLARLIEDREITLFGGTRLIRKDRYDMIVNKFNISPANLASKKIFAVHPSFRLIATATPPNNANPWLTNEVMHMFMFHRVSLGDVSTASIGELLHSIVADLPSATVAKLEKFAHSTRQLCADPVVRVTPFICILYPKFLTDTTRRTYLPQATAKSSQKNCSVP